MLSRPLTERRMDRSIFNSSLEGINKPNLLATRLHISTNSTVAKATRSDIKSNRNQMQDEQKADSRKVEGTARQFQYEGQYSHSSASAVAERSRRRRRNLQSLI